MALEYSSLKTSPFSVPQGSCAGPILFNLHSSTISDHVPDNILLNGFADKHTLQIDFTPMINELDAIKNLEKSLMDISEWMCVNRLKMNESKTEFSLFGSRQQTAKCTVTNINVVGEEIAGSHLTSIWVHG